MKVTDIASQIATEYKSENKNNRPLRQEEPKVEDRAGDRVELSSRSEELNKMRETVRTAPEERAELVRSLKDKIENGEYKVGSRELAGDMLTDLLEEQSLLSK